MGQLATQINNMQAQGSNQLPAQTVVNPNGNANVSAISLRSGKVTEPAPEKNKKVIEVTSELSPSEPSPAALSSPSSVMVETEKN